MGRRTVMRGRIGWGARSRVSIGVVLMLALLSGCGDEGAPSSPSAGLRATDGGQATGPVPTRVWLAGLATADDPSDLQELTDRLVELGTAVVVSPASCFGGLDEPVDGYVAGVIAPTASELDRVLAELPDEPLFRVQVEDLCAD